MLDTWYIEMSNIGRYTIGEKYIKVIDDTQINYR